MRSLRKNLFISLLLWLLITLTAWPVFVAVNLAISYFVGEGSVIDTLTQEPMRNLIASFKEGYEASAIIASIIGLVAVVDYQLLTKHRFTGYFAGIFLIVACVCVNFIYFKDPGQEIIGFFLSGLALWILYKIVDVGFRLRRIG